MRQQQVSAGTAAGFSWHSSRSLQEAGTGHHVCVIFNGLPCLLACLMEQMSKPLLPQRLPCQQTKQHTAQQGCCASQISELTTKSVLKHLAAHTRATTVNSKIFAGRLNYPD